MIQAHRKPATPAHPVGVLFKNPSRTFHYAARGQTIREVLDHAHRTSHEFQVEIARLRALLDSGNITEKDIVP